MNPRIPEGLLVLNFEGLVVEYLPSGSRDCPRPEEVVGLSLFDEIFDSTEFASLREAFGEISSGGSGAVYRSLRINFQRGALVSRYLVGFIPSPLPGRLLMSIAVLAHPDLPMTSRLRPDSVRGSLTDAAGLRVLMANADLWRAVEAAAEGLEESDRLPQMIGRLWGRAHAERVESFVQRKTVRTLRELELETALEYLSGSLAVIGLGRFETNLEQRHEGLIIVDHHESPFPGMLDGRKGCCRLLEGFHAGIFSYLSGRNLDAMELCCVAGGAPVCRFLLGTDRRIQALRRRHSTADIRLLDVLQEGCR